MAVYKTVVYFPPICAPSCEGGRRVSDVWCLAPDSFTEEPHHEHEEQSSISNISKVNDMVMR